MRVSKATGVPLAKIAVKLMTGRKLEDLGLKERIGLRYTAVKEAIFPFKKLPGVDPVLGPEMRSTGEIMGIADEFGLAYYKAELAAGMKLPKGGNALISVRDRDKPKILKVAEKLLKLGFKILATGGTAEHLKSNRIPVERILKLSEGRPNVVDRIINRRIDLIINTLSGRGARNDDYHIRRAAVDYGVPYITTVSGAMAAVKGIEAIKGGGVTVKAIQDYHRELETTAQLHPPEA